MAATGLLKDRNQLLKSTTHFFIIGGQHTVECYKNLVEAGEIDEADKAKPPASISFLYSRRRPTI